MSKQVRTLIIAGVAVLALIGLLLGLLFLLPGKEGEETSTTASSSTITMLDKSTDADGKTVSDPVSKVVIRRGELAYTISPDEEGQLLVEGFEDLPVNTSALSTLTSNLATMTASRKVADNAENAADYGLDDPQATAEITYADGTTATVELGNENPVKDGYYVRVSTDEAIYIAGSGLSTVLLKDPEDYIGTSLITAPATREDDENGQAMVYGMNLSGTVRTAKPFSFRVYEEGDPVSLSTFTYVTSSPKVYGVDPSESVQSTFSSATTLSAVKAVKAHPTEEERKTYGLDDPYSVGELTLAIQTSSTDDDGNTSTVYYNKTTHTIRLGGKDEDGNYYALVDDYDAVYTINPSSVGWAEVQYGDMLGKFLFMANITDVASISVSADGKETTFQLEHFPDETENDDKLKVTVDGTVYPTEDFRTLYQIFMRVDRYGDTDKTPSGDPDVTFTLKPIDTSSSPVVARFYKQSASIYLCQLEGGDAYTVKASDVQKMLNQMNNYLEGKKVNN